MRDRALRIRRRNVQVLRAGERAMVTVERDGNYLVYKRDGVEFYDTAIPTCKTSAP